MVTLGILLGKPQLPTPPAEPHCAAAMNSSSARTGFNRPPSHPPTHPNQPFIPNPPRKPLQEQPLTAWQWADFLENAHSIGIFQNASEKSTLHPAVNVFLHKWFSTFIFNILTLSHLWILSYNLLLHKFYFCYTKLKLISKPWSTFNIFFFFCLWSIDDRKIYQIYPFRLLVIGWLIVQLHHTNHF